MKLSVLAKNMLKVISVLSLIGIIASVIYYRSSACLPFIYGILLGSFVSVVKVIVLERTVDKALEMEKKSAVRHVYLQHILRLLLVAAVLLIAAIVEYISLWGAIAGVLSFQISLYVLKVLKKT